MTAWTIGWMAFLAPALALDPAVVNSQTGWEDGGERKTDVGKARLWSQAHDDAYCVRAGIQVAVPVQRLMEVAADIPSAPHWSTQNLMLSEVLRSEGPVLEYWQYLDVPNWMLVADRYWVVRGRVHTPDDGTARFTWATMPATTHPAADTQARTLSDQAIRLPVTVGAWTFEARGDGTWTTYTNCADPGGKLPDWVVRFAATRTVPDNLADLVREALARHAAARVATP